MSMMAPDQIMREIIKVCKGCGVKKLLLIGSFATGTATPSSDIDIAVCGCRDVQILEEKLNEIETLRKIDVFDCDSIGNRLLLEDIERYGKQIY